MEEPCDSSRQLTYWRDERDLPSETGNQDVRS